MLLALFSCEKITKTKYKASYQCKNLGMTFQNNIKWSAHFEKGGEAVINRCKRELGALKRGIVQLSLEKSWLMGV